MSCLQATDQRLREMQERLETTEDRQNTIVGFLARVAQNPAVLQQMVSVAQSTGLQRLGNKHSCESQQAACKLPAAATSSWFDCNAYCRGVS